MKKIKKIEVLIVGAGQAGLSISYLLAKHGIRHVVLEKGEVADSWKNQRWDIFQLTTQNWQNRLPGFRYKGKYPAHFSSKVEVTRYLESYQQKFKLPVKTGIEVQSINKKQNDLFEVLTNHGKYLASSVVIATGSFSTPNIPKEGSQLPQAICQIHSSAYRNPGSLPPGAVLVIGGGQSGFEIASDLSQRGRKVYLSMGRTFFLPRRYRGSDIMHWLSETGIVDLPASFFPGGPRMSSTPSPVILRDLSELETKKKPGSQACSFATWLNSSQVTLLGRFSFAEQSILNFDQNLPQALSEAKTYYQRVTRLIDSYIKKNKITSTAKGTDCAKIFFPMLLPTPSKIDLQHHPIKTVIWSTGFREKYSWIHLPVFSKNGNPQFKRGITQMPGFYFLGLHWLHNLKSGSLFGVKDDALYIFKDLLQVLSTQSFKPQIYPNTKSSLATVINTNSMR